MKTYFGLSKADAIANLQLSVKIYGAEYTREISRRHPNHERAIRLRNLYKHAVQSLAWLMTQPD